MPPVAGGGMLIGFPVWSCWACRPVAKRQQQMMITIPRRQLTSATATGNTLKRAPRRLAFLLIPHDSGAIIGACAKQLPPILPNLVPTWFSLVWHYFVYRQAADSFFLFIYDNIYMAENDGYSIW